MLNSNNYVILIGIYPIQAHNAILNFQSFSVSLYRFIHNNAITVISTINCGKFLSTAYLITLKTPFIVRRWWTCGTRPKRR